MQHAIDLACHLGKQRIWIDALCIIQDDNNDWNREAARMADVYENSFLTIAAWGASSSDQGLFTIRDPLLLNACKLYEIPEADKSMFASIEKVRGSPYELPSSYSPLYKRGWVIQERLFAPRTLNVGSYVSWECRTGSCTEIRPDLHDGLYPFKNIFELGEEIHQNDRTLELWNQNIVREFTSARLTKKGDRLVAISGAIRRIGLQRNWRNIHGLWEPFLVEQLQWRRSGRDKMPEIFTSNRTGAAPSWSWASIDAPVDYPHVSYWNRDCSHKVILAQKIPAKSQTNEESASESPSLALKGHLFELVIVDWSKELWCSTIAIGGRECDSWWFSPDLSDPVITTSCWFLLLSIITAPPSGPRSRQYRFATGLALMEVADKPGKYERIGFLSGYLKGFPRKLRVQFDESPTQDITII
ncbi:hypothetical protein EG329_014370 [Mollisiaceae sp. DMI_Dod_QoI]|nr:hypothetical protein EG329_014370 [Helotiales sp. DMI_Dod_QoI]